MKTYVFKSVLITFRAKGFSHRLFSVNYFKFLRIQKQRSRGVLRIRFLKICSKFTGENPCRNAISIKLLGTFIKIALQHGCSPVNLLHIFRTPFPRNTFGWLLLKVLQSKRTAAPLFLKNISTPGSVSIKW